MLKRLKSAGYKNGYKDGIVRGIDNTQFCIDLLLAAFSRTRALAALEKLQDYDKIVK